MSRLAVLLACLCASLQGAEAPSRIVSTSPSITETLFALGLGDQVVAVSQYCRHPAEVKALPTVGPFLQPDVELIARLRPDLTIVHPGPNGLERRLASVHIPFIAVERGSLASVFSSIRIIGVAAGIPDRANALVATLEARLDRVRKAVAGHRPQRVLLIVGRRPGTLADLVAVGRSSYLSDLAAIAGGVNVLSDDGLPEYPRISMETVIRLAPDAIIDAGDMGDTPEERQSRQILTEGLWRRQQLDAARAGRVHAVISDAFVVPGPHVVEATETMARWLHGIER
ncbi:MAG: ABC transporter substrate-binding protein [Vicinamibacterales bacterium]